MRRETTAPTFYRLPTVPGRPVRPAAPASVPETKPAPNRPTILLAERREAVRQAHAFRLRLEGFDVLEAETAWSFLDALAGLVVGVEPDGARKPCLVVADVDMPGLSAFEDLHAIPGARAPVLLCTTPGLTETVLQRARSIGAHAIFELPAEDQALIDACTILAPTLAPNV